MAYQTRHLEYCDKRPRWTKALIEIKQDLQAEICLTVSKNNASVRNARTELSGNDWAKTSLSPTAEEGYGQCSAKHVSD